MNGKKSNAAAHIGYVPTDIRDGSLSWIRDRRLSSALPRCAPASRAQERATFVGVFCGPRVFGKKAATSAGKCEAGFARPKSSSVHSGLSASMTVLFDITVELPMVDLFRRYYHCGKRRAMWPSAIGNAKFCATT
ncbi:hypothetical protein [Agrobacterium rubi]|uniref:Uncharacterized protein n=1 Tax=Agrobacterium rubi TaxID=28099 RepID=A0AAE7UP28_9HYPH|nr:hypothetical protein [Agrobacterium rubi]NTE86253.1 hypothetical protein [Agrobacterium rubi]NTF02185.1 hypothetical protein [Agrobacterium rubi]NTF36429.1 hypothetical protein [Agrobacterium rubi]QTF98901.1 hypothetical protein G6M88_00060 [Agrobacterium rubi]